MSRPFKPSSWLATIDFIKRLLQNSHLLLVVMSDQRGGKSTFIQLLRDKLASGFEVKILSPFEVDDSEELINIFHPERREDARLHKPPPSPAVTEEPEDGTVSFARKEKRPVLLIIDDAHQLSPDYLAQLVFSYRNLGSESDVFLCLASDFGLTSFLHHLESEGLTQFIHTVEPGALTETEAKTYAHKYLQGQKKRSSLLSVEKFKVFYTVTQGNLNAMHTHLDLWLEQQTQQEKFIKRLLLRLFTKPLLIMALFVSVGVGFHYLKYPGLSRQKSELIHQDTVLISHIPNWALGKHEQISPPPLNQYVELTNQAETEDSQWVVMDKVVVIPEIGARVD